MCLSYDSPSKFIIDAKIKLKSTPGNLSVAKETTTEC